MLALLLSLLSVHASAETLLGHNLTPTSNTLSHGQTMAGTYAIAYGITDELTVGTSPWLILQYNMPALDARYGFETGGFFDRIAVEQIYFKTYVFGMDLYRQESTWTRLTASHTFSPVYRLHLDFGAQYFFDDTVPFSMRPVPTNHTPITLSASALHQFRISETYGAFAESGLLGFNYPNRYLHLGLSGYYRWGAGGYLQLGFSKSIPIGPETISTSDFSLVQNSHGNYRASVYRKEPAPFHPEIQIQFLL